MTSRRFTLANAAGSIAAAVQVAVLAYAWGFRGAVAGCAAMGLMPALVAGLAASAQTTAAIVRRPSSGFGALRCLGWRHHVSGGGGGAARLGLHSQRSRDARRWHAWAVAVDDADFRRVHAGLRRHLHELRAAAVDGLGAGLTGRDGCVASPSWSLDCSWRAPRWCTLVARPCCASGSPPSFSMRLPTSLRRSSGTPSSCCALVRVLPLALNRDGARPQWKSSGWTHPRGLLAAGGSTWRSRRCRSYALATFVVSIATLVMVVRTHGLPQAGAT